MSTKQDKMATWPIEKLLFSMGIPAVFSMLIQAFYNIIDSIYISKYSADGMFAVGLANPLQQVALSIALGGAIGTATLVARRLGEGRKEEANAVASTGIVLALIHYIVVALLGIFLSAPFMSLFTKRPEVIDLGYQYLIICMLFNFGQIYSIFFERILQAQGNMLVPTLTQLLGAIINIILDPILIFGRYGFPEMGIAGAAIATIIGQIVSACFIGYMVIRRKHGVHFSLKSIEFTKERLKDIYVVALPTTVMNMISSVTTTLLNNILVKFNEDAVTSLSLYFKLQSFVFMPVFGFNQGALPILSYTYGAQNKERYKKTAFLYLSTASVFMAIGTILFYFFPDLLLCFFEMNDNLKMIAEMTLRIISLSFIPAAVSIVITTVLQSFGRGVISMMESIMRQIIFLVPAAYLLSNISLEAVFYAYPIAEVLVVLVFIPLTIKTYRKAFKLA